MLLSGLKRKNEGPSALAVDALTHDSAGHPAHQRLIAGDEARRRAAEIGRDSQGLSIPHRDIRAPLPGRGEHPQGEGMGGNDEPPAGFVNRRCPALQILQGTVDIRRLHQHAGQFLTRILQGPEERGKFHPSPALIQFPDFHIPIAEVGFDDAPGTGVQGGRRQQYPGLPPGIERHGAGLGGGGETVVEGGIGNRQAGYFGHHRLKLEEHLEVPLSDFRLIGRVGGNEFGASGQMLHRRGNHMIVLPGTGEQGFRTVLRGQRLNNRQNIRLGQARRKVQRTIQADILGDIGEKIVDTVHADSRQHVFYFAFRLGQVRGQIFPPGASSAHKSISPGRLRRPCRPPHPCNRRFPIRR